MKQITIPQIIALSPSHVLRPVSIWLKKREIADLTKSIQASESKVAHEYEAQRDMARVQASLVAELRQMESEK